MKALCIYFMLSISSMSMVCCCLTMLKSISICFRLGLSPTYLLAAAARLGLFLNYCFSLVCDCIKHWYLLLPNSASDMGLTALFLVVFLYYWYCVSVLYSCVFLVTYSNRLTAFWVLLSFVSCLCVSESLTGHWLLFIVWPITFENAHPLVSRAWVLEVGVTALLELAPLFTILWFIGESPLSLIVSFWEALAIFDLSDYCTFSYSSANLLLCTVGLTAAFFSILSWGGTRCFFCWVFGLEIFRGSAFWAASSMFFVLLWLLIGAEMLYIKFCIFFGFDLFLVSISFNLFRL